MAEVEISETTKGIAESVKHVVADVLNDTFGKNEQATREPQNPVDQCIALAVLVILAILPIIIGSWRAASNKDKDKTEVISSKDAMQFPLIASVALFSLFLVFKVFPKEYLNWLLAIYFCVLGTWAMFEVGGSYLNKLFKSIPNREYCLTLTEKNEDKLEYLLNNKIDIHSICSLVLCAAAGVWYYCSKHWIANNLIGLAFSINAIQLLKLNSVATGAILLAGLFIYDIFWVFGTNVMVTVAKNFNAPIKIVFPNAFLETGLYNSANCAMLGLGDIVLPGIFIALLLRFDLSISKDKRTYFHCGLLSYLIGLLTTMFVMLVFKHAQPALLYLVPTCVGFPLALAWCKGDLKTMLMFNEDTEENEESCNKENKKEE